VSDERVPDERMSDEGHVRFSPGRSAGFRRPFCTIPERLVGTSVPARVRRSAVTRALWCGHHHRAARPARRCPAR
jgi:hypothetical protein